MTAHDKLAVLGQVSERARQLEDGRDPIEQLLDALMVLAAARDLPWFDFRPTVELVAASAVNALLAGDSGHAERRAAVEHVLDHEVDLGSVVV